MRVFFSLLFAFAIALQGNLGNLFMLDHCNRGQGCESLMSAIDSAYVGEICCNDAETLAETGMPCKAGMSCSTSVPYFFASFPADELIIQTNDIAPLQGIVITTINRSGVWRPPSLS